LKRNRRYNKWGYAYADGFVVLAEGLDMFRLELLTLAGIRTRQGQFVLYEKNFGWLDVWELNPERWDRFG
jgi:hypothetical protein